MGFFSKFIPKEIKKPINKVIGGVSKVTDKLLPNELRFLAPYAAGIGTLMLPPGMGPLMRGLAGAGFNTLGQIASDETPIEDIDDLNKLSIALSGGLGALGSQDVTKGGESGMGIRTGNVADEFGTAGNVYSDAAPTGFLEGAGNVGREGVASLSDFVQGNRQTLADLGQNPGSLFSSADKFKGARDAAKALGTTGSLATGDVAREAAIDIIDEQNRLDAEEAAQIEETTTANESERADLQMKFMRQANVPEETVEETLEMNDLGEYYTPPESAANGGIIGLKEGGRARFAFGGRLANAIRLLDDAPLGLGKQMEDAARTSDEIIETKKIVKNPNETMRPGMIDAQAAGQPKEAAEFIEAIRNPNTGGIDYKMAEMKIGTKLKGTETMNQLVSMYLFTVRKDKLGVAAIATGYGGLGAGAMMNEGQNYMANGGIARLKDGGMLNFGGREMDLRTGGFVPIGKKERADDVPARLSKNEFVMTADAVRAAGGGNVNKGAQRMYDIMNKLEARA